MQKLKHFLLAEQSNILYQHEAISSIALTKDIANKINELIDAYNQLSETDLNWKREQEGTIRKAIIYIKDNLVNTLDDLMQIKGPEIVARYVEDLETRLDNLLGTIREGHTTMDAEVVDARIGFNRVKYANTGESIRKQFEAIVEMIDAFTPIQKLDFGNLELGYISSSGELIESQYTLRTKEFITPNSFQCYLINKSEPGCVIRIFRYSLEGVYEKEYLNSDIFKLDLNKKYKMSFTFEDPKVISSYDIGRFNLYHYRECSTITPEMFGAVPNDDTVNNEPAFYMMIEYLKTVCPTVLFEGRPVIDLKGITFKFSGQYSIAGAIYFPDILNGVFDQLRVKQIGTEDSYILNLGYCRDCRFSNMLLDGNYISSCILLRDGYSNLSIKDSVICHFTYYGIRTSGNGGHELNIVGNKIFQTEYQNFDTMLATNTNGCAILLTDGHTDNLIADNIICYVFGENIIQISSGSLMFNGNHIYNASHGEIRIHGTNGVYNGNFFDVVTVHDSRGGNFFNGNTFMSTAEYKNVLMKFTNENFYGRKTYIANNILKCPEGYLFEDLDKNNVILSNNYQITV